MNEQRDLASLMYPALTRDAKAREATATQWRAEQKQRSAMLLADLRELRQRIDARLQREGGRL
jgi:hypothetical protein